MSAPRSLPALLAAVFLAAGPGAMADLLKLTNGKVLSGTFEGASATAVRFDTGSGPQEIATADISSITFIGWSQPGAPAPARPAAPPPPPAAPRSVTVPAGTVLTVRVLETVSSQNAVGSRFATRLEMAVSIGGVVVLPVGAKIYGKVTAATQERLVLGRSSLELALSEIATTTGSLPIATTNFKEAAATGNVAQAAGGALVGAAMGGLIDGHDGAQTGAAWGAAIGVLQRGETMTVTPGTLLEFSLTAPLTLTVR